MKLKYNFIVRNVGEKPVAVAVGADSEKFNGMIKLNETGEFIFKKLSDGIDFQPLVTQFAAEFGVSEEQASADIQRFIDSLRAADVVCE